MEINRLKELAGVPLEEDIKFVKRHYDDAITIIAKSIIIMATKDYADAENAKEAAVIMMPSYADDAAGQIKDEIKKLLKSAKI